MYLQSHLQSPTISSSTQWVVNYKWARLMITFGARFRWRAAGSRAHVFLAGKGVQSLKYCWHAQLTTTSKSFILILIRALLQLLSTSLPPTYCSIRFLYIGEGTMGAMGAAAPIKFALWGHLIWLHNAFAWGRFCPAPIRKNHLPTPVLYK